MPRAERCHYVCGSPHQAFPYIVNSVLVQPQNIVLITPLDQMPYILPDILVQLLKDRLRLLHAKTLSLLQSILQGGLLTIALIYASRLTSSVRGRIPFRY